MPLLRDVALLAARIVIGLVFVVHGYAMLLNLWFATQELVGLGIPFPSVVVWATILVNIIGGICFAAGAGLPVAGVALGVVSLGSLMSAGTAPEYYSNSVPPTYILVMAVSCMAIGLNGGTFTVGRLVTVLRARRGSPDRANR